MSRQGPPYPDPTYYDTYSEDELPPPSSHVSKKRRLSEATSMPHAEDSANYASSSRNNDNGYEESGTSSGNRNAPYPKRPPALEASWINAEPFDEFIRQIVDFLLQTTRDHTNVEIEAKVGVLIDTTTNLRVYYPVLTEMILLPDAPNVRFETNMSLEQHAHYNKLLNKRVETTNLPTYQYSRLEYAHTRVIDSFHKHPDESLYPAKKAPKIRVSTDQKTQKVIESVKKQRIADLNVFSPKCKVDWRISVSIEEPVPPPTSPVQYTRRKDRLSYTHQGFRIDLTQVSADNQATPPQHELEVEFRDADELQRLGTLREEGNEAGYQYDELVRIFVNNIRLLVRNAL